MEQLRANQTVTHSAEKKQMFLDNQLMQFEASKCGNQRMWSTHRKQMNDDDYMQIGFNSFEQGAKYFGSAS